MSCQRSPDAMLPVLLILLWGVSGSERVGKNMTVPLSVPSGPPEWPSSGDYPEAHQMSFPGLVSATEPYIDPATPPQVKAYVGSTAFIPCIVNNLGQRSVSWVRHHDIHVLTVGRFTFTNDDRFQVHHDDGSNEWILKLRSPKTNDTGNYECQINTKPTITQLIALHVLEPRAVITAGSELYLDRGSTLRLTCRLTHAPAPAEFLLWYHEQKVANYEVDKVEVKVRVEENTTISTLTLTDAQVYNSGTYTCSPANAKAASITVHVLSGEHPAAMQTNSSASTPVSLSLLFLSLSCFRSSFLSLLSLSLSCFRASFSPLMLFLKSSSPHQFVCYVFTVISASFCHSSFIPSLLTYLRNQLHRVTGRETILFSLSCIIILLCLSSSFLPSYSSLLLPSSVFPFLLNQGALPPSTLLYV